MESRPYIILEKFLNRVIERSGVEVNMDQKPETKYYELVLNFQKIKYPDAFSKFSTIYQPVKKIRECDVDCAVREFCEETQLLKDDIQIIKNINPFQEIFFGTNNILYKHVYYIAKNVKEKSKIFVDNNCLEQMREVRDVKWLSYNEVLSHIKYHNTERIEIFMKVHNIIKETLLL